MEDAGKALREYRARITRGHEQLLREFAETEEIAKRARFAWADGHDTLYKFKSMSGAGCTEVEDMIEKSRIYFSVPDQFNDPLDCAPVLKPAKPLSPEFIEELKAEEERMITESGASPEEIAELRKSQLPMTQMGPAVTAEVRGRIRADVRIFCLTARQDHPLQWAHYADSHRGVCLHFKCGRRMVFGMARAVDYQKERAPILMPLHYNASTDEIADRMVLTKADFWGYESEYRIIRHEGVEWNYPVDGRYCSFAPRELTGITMGMNIGAAERDLVITWAAKHVPELAVYKAIEDPDRFGIEIRRIR